MLGRLERHQFWIYLGAVAVGLGVGSVLGDPAERLEVVIHPLLALLLFATFAQIRIGQVRAALADRRFLAAALVANFVIVPVIVWGLLPLVGDDPAVRFGVALVLLVPCTDWFVTFTHLSRGDTPAAVALTPVNLLAQLALLPLYLWLLLGDTLGGAVDLGSAKIAFLTLIALPLAAAWALQLGDGAQTKRLRISDGLGAAVVPLVAVVILVVATSQVSVVTDSLDVVPRLVGVYGLYAALALAVGVGVARQARLGAPAARTLTFSVGTRNSFVVLPFALAAPAGFELAVVVVVLQSLVELVAMAVYLRAVPRLLPGLPCRP